MSEPSTLPDAPGGPEARLGEAEASRLTRLARLGVVVLGARTVVLQALVFVSTIAFARLLDPKDFGVYASAQFALSFFTFFGDCGVGGALIRQKHEPTQRELSSVFFFQIGLATALIAAIFAVAGFAPVVWPDMPAAAPWLIRALAVDLLLTAARTIPAILLERALDFRRLAVLDIIVQLSFLACSLPLAARGLGVWALAGGAVFQGVVSLLGAYALRPWRPSLAFDWPVLSPIVRFGLTYQVKNVVAFVNGAVTPLYAGNMLGLRDLGLVNWARETAWAPLKVVEILARVNYPLYARLQGDRRLFANALARSVQVCGIVTLAFVGFFWGMGPNVTRIVYSEKWLPALPFLYLYALAISVGFLAPIVGAALDAVGRPAAFAKLSIGWTALNWLVVGLTTPRWGAMGFVGGFIVHVIVGNLAVMVLLRRLVPEVRFLPRMAAAIVGAAAVVLLGRYVLSPWAVDWPRFIASIAACLAVFAGVLVAIDRSVLGEVRAVLQPSKAAPHP